MCKGFLGNDYRYGFNGQEKVDEIAGVGNHNTALFWEYDTRLGRRWNVDPKGGVDKSKYSCLGDNPIANIDKPGDDFWYFNANGILLCVIQTSNNIDVVYRINNNNTVQCLSQFYQSSIQSRDINGNTCTGWDRATQNEKATNLILSATGVTVNKNFASDDGGVIINKRNGVGSKSRTLAFQCQPMDYTTLAVGSGTLPTPAPTGEEAPWSSKPIPSAPIAIPGGTTLQPNLGVTLFDYNKDGTRVTVTKIRYTDEKGNIIPTTSPAYREVSKPLTLPEASKTYTLPPKEDNTEH
jgi:hypothetical protein